MTKYPSYLKLSKTELEERAKRAWNLLTSCRVCPRRCGVNRIKGKDLGFCQMQKEPVVSSYHAHFGEEAPLVGIYGSGTIFFTSCNLACVYCQNWEISQLRIGQKLRIEDLSEIMLSLQVKGCHNINLVSPTIWIPQILKAFIIAIDKGLKLPFIYNSGGYDSVESLKLLDGVIDIYMPDIKYSDSKIALKYSFVPNYWQVVQKAVTEMHRQVGDLTIENGLAKKGLLIRHLILPNNLAVTKKVIKFITSLSKNSYINIMDQYYPTNKASFYPEINRGITQDEYKKVFEIAKKYGLSRFDKTPLFYR